jgi:hypothetical protein
MALKVGLHDVEADCELALDGDGHRQGIGTAGGNEPAQGFRGPRSQGVTLAGLVLQEGGRVGLALAASDTAGGFQDVRLCSNASARLHVEEVQGGGVEIAAAQKGGQLAVGEAGEPVGGAEGGGGQEEARVPDGRQPQEMESKPFQQIITGVAVGGHVQVGFDAEEGQELVEAVHFHLLEQVGVEEGLELPGPFLGEERGGGGVEVAAGHAQGADVAGADAGEHLPQEHVGGEQLQHGERSADPFFFLDVGLVVLLLCFLLSHAGPEAQSDRASN